MGRTSFVLYLIRMVPSPHWVNDTPGGGRMLVSNCGSVDIGILACCRTIEKASGTLVVPLALSAAHFKILKCFRRLLSYIQRPTPMIEASEPHSGKPQCLTSSLT